MKALMICLLSGLIIQVFCAPESYEVLKLPAGEVPVIDGSIDEWPQEYFIDSLHSDDNVRARDALEPWTREEIQMGLYMTWDDNWVYYAVKIIYDDVLITTGDSPWKMDNIKVNPGGQAMAFYIGIDGTVQVNPSSPYTLGTTLETGMNPNGNGDFPTYEFAIQKDMLDPFGMNMYQMAIGSEENDNTNTSDQCYAYVGFEYLGPKQDWNGCAWDNPLYYPTFTMVSQDGPPLSIARFPDNAIPGEDFFLSARPNPFTGSTKLWYQIGKSGTLNIYDLSGRRLRSFGLGAGSGSVVWNGTTYRGKTVATGAYILHLESGNQTRTLRLITGH